MVPGIDDEMCFIGTLGVNTYAGLPRSRLTLTGLKKRDGFLVAAYNLM